MNWLDRAVHQWMQRYEAQYADPTWVDAAFSLAMIAVVVWMIVDTLLNPAPKEADETR